MRKFLMTAACAAGLSLSACDTSETYPVSVSDAWAKVSSNGYAATSFGVPAGLLGADVRASFESFPGDRTGYWKFTRKGKELGRLNVAVEGDETSSTISYSYAGGNISEEDKKFEQMIRQYSNSLLAEAIDAKMENRSPDMGRKNQADAQTMMATVGNMMKGASDAMDEAVKKQEEASSTIEREAGAMSAKYNSTKPTTDLSGY